MDILTSFVRVPLAMVFRFRLGVLKDHLKENINVFQFDWIASSNWSEVLSNWLDHQINFAYNSNLIGHPSQIGKGFNFAITPNWTKGQAALNRPRSYRLQPWPILGRKQASNSIWYHSFPIWDWTSWESVSPDFRRSVLENDVVLDHVEMAKNLPFRNCSSRLNTWSPYSAVWNAKLIGLPDQFYLSFRLDWVSNSGWFWNHCFNFAFYSNLIGLSAQIVLLDLWIGWFSNSEY